jgi:hypothetical protein
MCSYHPSLTHEALLRAHTHTRVRHMTGHGHGSCSLSCAAQVEAGGQEKGSTALLNTHRRAKRRRRDSSVFSLFSQLHADSSGARVASGGAFTFMIEVKCACVVCLSALPVYSRPPLPPHWYACTCTILVTPPFLGCSDGRRASVHHSRYLRCLVRALAARAKSMYGVGASVLLLA